MLSEEQINKLIKDQWDSGDSLCDRAHITAFIRAIEAECAKVPEGWVAVPKEPTQEMLEAANGLMCGTGRWLLLYKAMLAAAPKAQEGVPFKATVIFDDCTKIVEGVMPAA